MVPANDHNELCLACRLNRTIPDLGDPDNQRYWQAIESEKTIWQASQSVEMGLSENAGFLALLFRNINMGADSTN